MGGEFWSWSELQLSVDSFHYRCMNKLFHENNAVEFSRFCIQFLNNICTIDSWYGLSIYIGRLNHLIRIRQRNPVYKNPLSQRLTGQLLTGDPEQVQRLAPAFSQSMEISLHRGCSHLRPWCAHGIFRSRKSRHSVVFPSSRPTWKMGGLSAGSPFLYVLTITVSLYCLATDFTHHPVPSHS